MSRTDKRRADARRRAWGRGPMILRFEPLEGRALLSTATVTTPVTPMADLIGSSFSVPSGLTWGSSFDVKGTVTNQGTATAAGAFFVELYASTTPNFSSGAVDLGQVTIPAGLQAGASSSFDQQVSLPTSPLTTSGPVYVGMVVDPTDLIAESDKANNEGVGEGYDLALINITAPPAASLVGSGLTISVSQTSWGGQLQLNQQVNNVGPGDAPATRAIVVLTPSGDTPGTGDDVTIASISVPAIASGQSTTLSQAITLPTFPPDLLGSATSFTLSVVQDADYLTNQLYPHLATQGTGYDSQPITIDAAPSYAGTPVTTLPTLVVSNVATDTQNVKWGQNFQVTATIENTGSLDSGPFRVRFLLVGDNESTSSALFLADTTLSDIPAGYGQNISETLTLPAILPSGESINAAGLARIAVLVDPEVTFNQTSNAGNTAFSGDIHLQVVGTDGTTTPVATTAASTATSTTTPATKAVAKTQAQKVAAAKAARAAQALVKKKTVTHTTKTVVEHDLKVFPQKIVNYFKSLF